MTHHRLTHRDAVQDQRVLVHARSSGFAGATWTCSATSTTPSISATWSRRGSNGRTRSRARARYEDGPWPVDRQRIVQFPGAARLSRPTSRCACTSATRDARASAAITISRVDGQRCADGAARMVWIDRASGRPVPLPEGRRRTAARGGPIDRPAQPFASDRSPMRSADDVTRAMNLLAIVAALALEQWRAFEWRGAVERAFSRVRARHRAAVERRHVRAGRRSRRCWRSARRSSLAGLALVDRQPHSSGARLARQRRRAVPADGLPAFQPFGVGDRRGAEERRHRGRAARARRVARRRHRGASRAQDVARLAIERGLADAYRQVFGVLFWFMVLPGPVGAVLYRAAVLLADEWKGAFPATTSARRCARCSCSASPRGGCCGWLDWIPVRLTALSFAVVGDFEDAVYCWRTQARAGRSRTAARRTESCSPTGAGALGVQLGGPCRRWRRHRSAAGDRRRRRGRGGRAAFGGRPRLACADPVAAARVPAVARELGAVARRDASLRWRGLGVSAPGRAPRGPRCSSVCSSTHALRRDACPLATAACTAQPGSAIVPAVAEAAMRNQVAQLDERVGDCVRRAMRETEHLHAGRVDDPAGLRRASGRAPSTSSCGGRCAAPRRSRRSARRRRAGAR